MTAYDGPIYDAHAHLVSDDLQRYPRDKPFVEGAAEDAVF